jgi:hypothetical protein
MENVIESYLVRLGFQSDIPSFSKFQQMMEAAERSVTQHSSGIVKHMLGMQGAVIGAFVSVTGAVVTMMDKVAMADQGYRLMGERLLMTTEQARKMSMVTSALGATMAEIVWDPELSARARVMAADIDRMTAGLGPGFEGSMKGIRDIRMEFSRLEVGMKFLGMGFVSDLFTKLFPNKDMLGTITTWVTKFEDKIPELADKLSTYAVPILKETWTIFKGLGKVVKEGAIAFQNIIGVFTGDHAIEGTALNFDTMAKSVEHVEHAIEKMLNGFLNAEKTLAHASVSMSLLLHGDLHGAGAEMQQALHAPQVDENGKPIIDPETGEQKTQSGWVSGLELAGFGALGINMAGGVLKAGGRFLKVPLAVAKSPFKFAKWIKGLGGEVAGAEGTEVAAGAAAGAGEAVAGEAVAGGAVAAGAEAGGTGLLGFLGPVGWAAIAAIGTNWAARSIFPKFKKWEDATASKAWHGVFGGGTATTENVSNGQAVGADSDQGSVLTLDRFADVYFVPFVKLFEYFATQFDQFSSRFMVTPETPSGIGAAAQVQFAAKAPKYAEGAEITDSGMAMIHKGEIIMPGATNAPPSGLGSLVDKIATVIAQVESGGDPNAVSFRHNNPGNLRSWGDLPVVGGYVQFPTMEAGIAAEKHQIEKNIGRGLTLKEFFAGKKGIYGGWAPTNDKNDPGAYAATVGKRIGVAPDVPLNKLVMPTVPVNANAWTPKPEPRITQVQHTSHVSLGGIYITQPNADAQQIQRAVAKGVREGLQSQTQFDLINLQPAWG